MSKLILSLLAALLIVSCVANPEAHKSLEEVSSYLNQMAPNTATTPGQLAVAYHLGNLSHPNSQWFQLMDAIEQIGKYVELDLSGSTISDNKIEGTPYEDGYIGIKLPSYVTAITLPKTLTYIGTAALIGNEHLTAIILPEGLTAIGNSAFVNCQSLRELHIPSSVEMIGEYLFAGCHSLTTVTFPPHITHIPEGLFWECINLSNVSIPPSVRTIGANAFHDTHKLVSLTLPENISILRSSTFYNSGLQSIVLPKSLRRIEAAVFAENHHLERVTIQSTIRQPHFEDWNSFPGDLRAKYLENGKGVYTRSGDVWTLITPIEDEADDEIITIRVSTAAEFISALDSNRIIEMQPGKYILSDVDPFFDDHSPDISWYSSWGGENQLGLSYIENLTIRGLGEKVEILTAYSGAVVMIFETCKNIRIENITAGHTDVAYCGGGVLHFYNSSDINLDQAHLFGCGTEGLYLSNVEDMQVTNSSIYECTYNIIITYQGKNISFDNCIFYDNQEYDLVQVYGTENFTISNSTFKNNRGSAMFNVGDTSIIVRNTIFTDNEVQPRIMSSPNVRFIGCEFD